MAQSFLVLQTLIFSTFLIVIIITIGTPATAITFLMEDEQNVSASTASAARIVAAVNNSAETIIKAVNRSIELEDKSGLGKSPDDGRMDRLLNSMTTALGYLDRFETNMVAEVRNLRAEMRQLKMPKKTQGEIRPPPPAVPTRGNINLRTTLAPKVPHTTMSPPGGFPHQNGTGGSRTDARASIYQGPNFDGEVQEYSSLGRMDGACDFVHGFPSSILTYGTCVILYNQRNCRGASIVVQTMGPSDPNPIKSRTPFIIFSIGPCPN